MARRIPPTTRKLTFEITAEDAGGVIDIGQCLSLLNRKAFRQGMEYYVESFTLSANVQSQVGLQYLSQTWVNTNAWVKAFRTWMKSQEQLEDFDEIKGRYHDFKVFLGTAHAQIGMPANLKPDGIDFAAAALVDPTISANWAASHIQIPNDGAVGVTNEYELHMVGPDGAGISSKGIVAGYANSRSRPVQDDPNIVATASWMDFAFDDGDNLIEIRGDVISENDSPPYLITEDTNFEFYPGGSNQGNGAGFGMDITPPLAINPITGSFTTRHGAGFVAPCGLVQFDNVASSSFTLTLNIAVGPYKGVMARPMQDVN